jgi:hypothetical protein
MALPSEEKEPNLLWCLVAFAGRLDRTHGVTQNADWFSSRTPVQARMMGHPYPLKLCSLGGLQCAIARLIGDRPVKTTQPERGQQARIEFCEQAKNIAVGEDRASPFDRKAI